MPAGAVYVGRPTLWGNPFVCEADPALAVSAFRRLITMGRLQLTVGEPGGLCMAGNANPATLRWDWPEYAAHNLPRLRGRDLACWCALGQPCHADVLLEMANAEAARA